MKFTIYLLFILCINISFIEAADGLTQRLGYLTLADEEKRKFIVEKCTQIFLFMPRNVYQEALDAVNNAPLDEKITIAKKWRWGYQNGDPESLDE